MLHLQQYSTACRGKIHPTFASSKQAKTSSDNITEGTTFAAYASCPRLILHRQQRRGWLSAPVRVIRATGAERFESGMCGRTCVDVRMANNTYWRHNYTPFLPEGPSTIPHREQTRRNAQPKWTVNLIITGRLALI